MKRFLSILILFVALNCRGAAGDYVGAQIDPQGWQLWLEFASMGTNGSFNIGLGTNNSITGNERCVVTITSQGYDATGATTTRQRKLYGTTAVRFAYPISSTGTKVLDVVSNAVSTVVKLVLSDFVYAGDSNITVTLLSGLYTNNTVNSAAVVSAPVTNNSAAPYPKVIGHFSAEQRRPVNGVENVEVFAFHKYATGGKPVAKVMVTATGATSGFSSTNSATVMVKSSRLDSLPMYVTPFTLTAAAGFTVGELIVFRFTAYPWIGDATSILDSTTDAGDKIYHLGPLNWTLIPKTIAVVDATNGVDNTGVASPVQATADAAPFLTINRALTAISGTNSALYSLARIDGGEVQCMAGNYQVGKYSSQVSSNGYVTIMPHSSTTRAGVVFDGYVTDQDHYKFQRYFNVTFQRPGNGVLFFPAAGKILILERVNYNDVYSVFYAGDTSNDIEYLDCLSTNSNFCSGGNAKHSRLNRNTTLISPVGTETIVGKASCVLGLTVTNVVGTQNVWAPLSGGAQTNVVLAFCKLYSLAGDYLNVDGTLMRNFAVVQNVVERKGAQGTPLVTFSDQNFTNSLFYYNSFAGQRFNFENDITAAYVNKGFTDCILRYNSLDARGNHRADVFKTDASLVGGWSLDNSVGCYGNYTEAIAYKGDQDFGGLQSNTADPLATFVASQPLGYVANFSKGGTDAGNGDYHITSVARSQGIINLSGDYFIPWDIEGNARGNFDPPGAYSSASPRKGAGFF